MDVKRLNITDGSDPVPGFKGSDDVFRKLELKIGIKLPKAYIDLIRAADGGCPEVGMFYPIEGPEENSDNFFGVNNFYSFANPDEESIYDAIENWEGIPGKPTLPVGDDGGGNQIYLAWDTDVPSVWIFLHDENEARVKIANSFEEFIDKLFLDESLLD